MLRDLRSLLAANSYGLCYGQDTGKDQHLLQAGRAILIFLLF